MLNLKGLQGDFRRCCARWVGCVAAADEERGPFLRSAQEGERAVRALRQFGTPLVDLVGPTRYVDHQSGLDDTVPHGWHYYWKATSLACLSDEVIDFVAEHAYDATSQRSYAAIFHMGGAVARAPREAKAYPGRDVEHNIIIDAAWLRNRTSPSGPPRPHGHDKFPRPLQPHRAGVYVNFLDSDDDTSRVHEAYGDANHRRLAEIKAEYDPGSVFHINKNIKPEGRISEPPCDRHWALQVRDRVRRLRPHIKPRVSLSDGPGNALLTAIPHSPFSTATRRTTPTSWSAIREGYDSAGQEEGPGPTFLAGPRDPHVLRHGSETSHTQRGQ